MFSRWRIERDLARSKFGINYSELVGGNVLLIIGGIVLGIGIASFETFAAAFAVSISGGVMLFAGIYLTIRIFVAMAFALSGAAKAVKDITGYVEDIQQKTFGSDENKFNRYNNLQSQVEKLKKDVKLLLDLARSNWH